MPGGVGMSFTKLRLLLTSLLYLLTSGPHQLRVKYIVFVDSLYHKAYLCLKILLLTTDLHLLNAAPLHSTNFPHHPCPVATTSILSPTSYSISPTSSPTPTS
eukprot:756939-Hanusia_phi.AAC.3